MKPLARGWGRASTVPPAMMLLADTVYDGNIPFESGQHVQCTRPCPLVPAGKQRLKTVGSRCQPPMVTLC